MTTANASLKLAAPAAPEPFANLRCIRCGENCCLSLHLDSLTVFTCRECGEDFELSEVHALLAEWQRLLTWIGQAAGKT